MRRILPGIFIVICMTAQKSSAQQDDISSVAFWYQTEPHSKFPDLPDKLMLEIN